MSAKVNVVLRSGGVFQLKRNLAERRVSSGKFRWKEKYRFTLEEIRRVDLVDGPLGVGNALPLARIRNKLLKPKPLHYEIPAVGAHARLLRVRDVNKVQGDV